MPDLAIEFCGTRFAVNGRTIVGPLDLTIRRSETLVFLGRSGSGKTTSLRLINRLLVPTSGTVQVDGRSTLDWDPVRLRRRIGYMIQDVGLLPHFTVARNVGLVPRLERWPGDRVGARVTELLELVGLAPADFAHRLPHELSGGQRQRVGVARALAADPPILLCDEPFGALDTATRADLQREFAALIARLGKTVVFVTHDVREALMLASRIAVFHDGRIAFLGSVEEFASTDRPPVVALRGLT
ncbi:MAG: ATP-binding cassette domain-containing protein [Gemmatimonadetes bacterium]|nr:ATP-binding cassette domain-containing protein [Gemmatimonadota bacterium]